MGVTSRVARSQRFGPANRSEDEGRRKSGRRIEAVRRMGHSWAAEIVRFCIRWRWRVIALAAVATVVSTLYALTQFAINTNTEGLLGRDLPWEQASFRLPGGVSGAPDRRHRRGADTGTGRDRGEPAHRGAAPPLGRHPTRYSEPQGGAFAERSALLFCRPNKLGAVVDGLRGAAPAFGLLAADPSLRGAMQALTTGAGAVQAGRCPPTGWVDRLTRCPTCSRRCSPAGSPASRGGR